MNASSPRIPPLHPEEFTDAQKELVGPWSVLNFSRVLARHPSLYGVFVPVVEQVIRYTYLQQRYREVLVIRTLAQCYDTSDADHPADCSGQCCMRAAPVAAIQARHSSDQGRTGAVG